MSLTNSLQLLVVCAFSVSLIACDQSKSHRQSIYDQNAANTKAEIQNLRPAESDYSGQMIIYDSQKSYDFHLSLKIVIQNSRSSTQSQDPTQTIRLPKLSGAIKFPVLDHLAVEDYQNYAEIIGPMGGFKTVLIDFGSYDKNTGELELPYSIPGYNQGDFGSFFGTMKNGHFQGTWFSKPFGIVGAFDLYQVKSDAAQQNGKGKL